MQRVDLHRDLRTRDPFPDIDTRGRGRRKRRKMNAHVKRDRSGVREHVGRCHVGAIIKYERLLQ